MTELYPPTYEAPEIQHRLFPAISRPLPAGGHEPTGLVDGENYLAADVYATGEASWIPNYPQPHPSQMVDYDRLEEWLDQHLPPLDSLDALAIFTDTRPLDQIGAWRHTERLWCHRLAG